MASLGPAVVLGGGSVNRGVGERREVVEGREGDSSGLLLEMQCAVLRDRGCEEFWRVCTASRHTDHACTEHWGQGSEIMTAIITIICR